MTPRNKTITQFPDNRREQYLEKPLPSSEEAERVILGCILIDNALIAQAAARLTPEDFYSPLNRRVFDAMLKISHAGREINPIIIGEELRKEGSLDAIGGVATITNLTFGVPHFTNLDEFLRIVSDKSRLRQVIRTCNAIVSHALAEEDDAEAVMAEAQTKINEIALATLVQDETEGFVPLANVIRKEVIPGLEGLEKGISNKISTGFATIDTAIGGGLSTSDVMVLAGLPSSGKSALALQIAYNVAKSGIPTAFLAGEMTNKENAYRLLSQVSGVHNPNGLTYISGVEHSLLRKSAEWIADIPLYMDHRTADVHTLAVRLRAIVKLKGIKLLVIDYIQLLKVEKVDKRKRYERITEASQEVKRLANELDIAIIDVSQFNREGAKSGKPSMFDSDGSSQIEKDASLYLVIDRDETDPSSVTVRVLKGRNSGVSSFTGKFHGRCVKFEFDA